jgi:hypothetical protein
MGGNGVIFTSLDGDTWTNVSIGGLGSITALDCIIWTGQTWIAFGRDSLFTVVVTSPDGVALSRVDPPDARQVTFAASSDSIVVGGGETGFLVSTDQGANWSKINYSNGSYTLPPIAFGNGFFLAAQTVSHNNVPITIQKSTNGTSWADFGSISDLDGFITNMRFVVSHFYVVGGIDADTVFWRSGTGTDWTLINLGVITSPIVDIAFGNGNYVAIQQQQNSPCMTSVDGINFGPAGSLPPTTGGALWTRLTFADGIFVASSTSGELASSVTGASWTAINPSGSSGVVFADLVGQ